MRYVVQSFGSNGSGQLGVGHTEDIDQATDCLFEDGNAPVSRPMRVVAGGNHTVLWCEDGTTYTTGLNKYGRCGFDAANTPLLKFRQVVFKDEEEVLIDKFKHVAATWDASVFVTLNDHIYTCGAGTRGELGQGNGCFESLLPKRVLGVPEGEKIVDIAACMSHVVVILSNGQAYGWGRGRQGQLGDPRKDRYKPERLVDLRIRASKVVCGRDFTCISGSEQQAQTSRFQILGFDKWNVVSQAPANPLSASQSISACWGSILVLNQNGTVVGWGRDDHGQLGPSSLPRLQSLVAGSEHVLAQTQKSEILAWGWGEHGNCGLTIQGNGDVPRNSPNLVGIGTLIGAGCATSWIYSLREDRLE